jgi:hypothetical protein
MKEVHYLCLQLSKMMTEDILQADSEEEKYSFNGDMKFEQPTKA